MTGTQRKYKPSTLDKAKARQMNAEWLASNFQISKTGLNILVGMSRLMLAFFYAGAVENQIVFTQTQYEYVSLFVQICSLLFQEIHVVLMRANSCLSVFIGAHL